MTSVPLSVSRPAVRRAGSHEASLVARVAASTFADTFAAWNDPGDMAAYAAAAFGEDIQRAELLDPHTVVLLAERAGEVVGYAMLRHGEAAPECIAGRAALEIVRLYAVRTAIGQGVGAALMGACLSEAAAIGCDTVWLGVWEHNAPAIAFYQRWGFRDVGAHGFLLGADLQTDRLMARGVGAGAA